MSSPNLPSTLVARDGLALHVTHWPAGKPRGVVQLIHGLCEHAGRFADTAQVLNDAGWAVAAIDQRGHGLSGGPRGSLAQDDDPLHDQALLHDAITEAYPHAALRLVLGYSMGGLIAARLGAAQAGQDPAEPWTRRLDGLILVAPALQPNMSFTQRALLSAFGRLAPDLAVPVGFKPEWACSDPQEVDAAYRDPLIHDRITPRLTFFMLHAGQHVQNAVAQWRTPTLLLYSHADRLVLPGGCERFVAAAPAQFITAQAYQTLAHDLLHEPERHQVWGALTGWLEAQFASNAPGDHIAQPFRARA